MRVVCGDRLVGRKPPLGGSKRTIAAIQNIKISVRFAPDGDVGFAVAVVIVLDGRVGFRQTEVDDFYLIVRALRDEPR